MKMIEKGVRTISVFVGAFAIAVGSSLAQTYPPGVYYSEQKTNWPPLPQPPSGLAVYSLGGGKYLYNDTAVTYPSPSTSSSSGSSSRFSAMSSSSPFTGSGFSPLYSSTDLWIEMLGITNGQVFMRLHGTIGGELYQLDSTTNLDFPAKYWVPGEIITGDSSTNFTDFSPVNITNGNPVFPQLIPQQFFRAHYADTVIALGAVSPGEAGRPTTLTSGDGFNGQFRVSVTQQVGTGPATIPFTYWMSGGAVNGTDYQTLPGSDIITNSGGSGVENIVVVPLPDTRNWLDVDATMTLFQRSNYLIAPGSGSATVVVQDNYSGVSPFEFVTNATGNVGMAFHPGLNSLVISQNDFEPPPGGGSPPGLANFAVVSPLAVITNRSQIINLEFEVDLAVVQASTNGFTNGDMFFSNGNPGGIGWLAANGVTSNLTWFDLSTIDARETHAEAGFYIDQTGIFSNNLVVATDNGGIYTIDSNTNVTQMGFFNNAGTPTFESVITLPNNVASYGPFAGKILAGAERYECFFTVDTNRQAAFFNFNIIPEDIHIIPTNQDFYLNDVFGQVLKLPKRWLTNYVGDLLIVQELNPVTGDPPSAVYILHWDAGSTNFVKHGIRSPAHTAADFEQGTFAPLSIPSSSLSD